VFPPRRAPLTLPCKCLDHTSTGATFLGSTEQQFAERSRGSLFCHDALK
jgi:hypothetical protein